MTRKNKRKLLKIKRIYRKKGAAYDSISWEQRGSGISGNQKSQI
jgi:hypothetical protein